MASLPVCLSFKDSAYAWRNMIKLPTVFDGTYWNLQYVPSKTAGKTVIFLQCMYSHTVHARLLDLAYHNMHN